MRKHYFTVLVFIGIIILLIYMQFGREVTARNTNSTASSNYYELNLSVVANKIFIVNKKAFAEEMIEKCRENSFRKILFSYDVSGYPNKVKILVYTNSLTEKYGIENFTVIYETKTDTNVHYKNVGYLTKPLILRHIRKTSELNLLPIYY